MVTDWISKWAGYTPIKMAVRDAHLGSDLTYQQLNSLSNYLGEKLVNAGLQKGDRVVLLSEFRLELIVLAGAAMKKGFILVPLNYRLSSREIAYMVNDCKPQAIMIEDQFEKLLDLKQLDFKVANSYRIDALAEDLHQVEDQVFLDNCINLDEDDALFILYTSGTTGFPKGAIYTYKMAFWNATNTQLRLDITSQDHTVICMPPFHTGGWNVLLLPFLFQGASFSLIRKFEAGHVLKCLEEEEANMFMGVPTMLKMMADDPIFEEVDLEKLRYFIVGGEPMPIPLIEIWEKKGVPIRQGYGLTEVGPNVTSLHHSDAIRKIGSIGTPNFFIETKIAQELDTDSLSGELLLKGPAVTPGYWNNSEATEKAFIDGWFKTGDIIEVDEEGYYYVKDRIKNMYISGGENVYPAEVEKYLSKHPKVDEVAIIGVSDSRWGEVGKAFIVSKAEVTSEEILHYCQGNLAKFKIPKYFTFLPELPKNATGKIDRLKLG